MDSDGEALTASPFFMEMAGRYGGKKSEKRGIDLLIDNGIRAIILYPKGCFKIRR